MPLIPEEIFLIQGVQLQGTWPQEAQDNLPPFLKLGENSIGLFAFRCW
jgi:hypothetical protein